MVDDEPKDRTQKTPEQQSWPLSSLLFCYVSPLIRLGKRRQLTENDYWNLKASQTTSAQTEDFEEKWQAEVQRKESGEAPKESIARIYRSKFCCKLFLALLLKLFQ